jgi:hypothetical protein
MSISDIAKKYDPPDLHHALVHYFYHNHKTDPSQWELKDITTLTTLYLSSGYKSGIRSACNKSHITIQPLFFLLKH